jgi:hypothetical protein
MNSHFRVGAAKALKKIILAILIAFFLALLGLFGNLGYHVNSANESIKTYSNTDYMDLTISLDMTFNPLLYPFYWLMGNGHLSENKSGIIAIPQSAQQALPSYHPPSHHRNAGPTFAYLTSKEDRLETFTLIVATREVMWNLVSLLTITIAIELTKERLFYLVLLFGIIGFYFGAIVGMVAGLIVGAILAILRKFRLTKFNIKTLIFSIAS